MLLRNQSLSLSYTLSCYYDISASSYLTRSDHDYNLNIFEIPPYSWVFMLCNFPFSSDNPLNSKKTVEPEKPKKRESRWEKEEPQKETKKDPFKPPKPGEKRKSALDEIMEVTINPVYRNRSTQCWLQTYLIHMCFSWLSLHNCFPDVKPCVFEKLTKHNLILVVMSNMIGYTKTQF